jgi:hypothetical protein
MTPSREMDKEEKREGEREIEKKDRENKDRQTDRQSIPDMPDPRSFSSEYDRWHKKWQLEKFNTTHADKIGLIIK